MLAKNIFSNLVVFIVNLLTTFLLTPFISKNLGGEALGLMSLGFYFINLCTLFSIAINSLSARHITIELTKKNTELVNTYFTTLFYSNLFFSFVFIIFSFSLIFNIEYFINITNHNLDDFKIFLCLLSISFIISIFASLYSVGVFAVNKIYLESKQKVFSLILKTIFLFIIFLYFRPKLFFIGLATLISVAYMLIIDKYYFLKFLNIKISYQIYFNINKLTEIIKSSLYNSLIKVSQIFLDGIDLIISNLFVSSIAMGQIAISKILLTALLNIITVFSSAFLPNLTVSFAKNNGNYFLQKILKSIRLQRIFGSVAPGLFIVFGKDFLKIWIPDQDFTTIYYLTLASIFPIFFIGSLNSLYDVFVIINKLKSISLVFFFSSILNLLIVFLLLEYTNLGSFAIVSTSAVIGLIRTLMYTIPFYSNYFKIKKNVFYFEVIKSTTALLIFVLIGLFIKSLFSITYPWIDIVIKNFLTLIIGLPILSKIFFLKSELILIQKKVKMLITFNKI